MGRISLALQIEGSLMQKTDNKAIAQMLLAAVDLRRNLALSMFRVDNPNASQADFDAADTQRYFGYADAVMGDLIESPLANEKP